MGSESAKPPAGRRVVFLTDGETDWYGDDYAIERQRWSPLGLELAAAGCTTEANVLKAVEGAEAVVSISVRVPVTARVIRALNRCRIIVRAGVGTNNVDLDESTTRGIVVTNVPDYCTADVADHTVALIMTLVRRIPFLDHFVRSGGWQYSVQFTGPVPRLSTMVLGLVGYGRIARVVAEQMRDRVKRMLAHDPHVSQEAADPCGVTMVSLDELLTQSDIISLHLPLTPETHQLIGRQELDRVKPVALLVNTSRGAVVDEHALAEALREGRLACAGLDVLAQEPLQSDHPLASLPNVVLTPHFAGYSESAKVDLRTSVASAVADVFLGRWPAHCVNPEVNPRYPLRESGQ